MLIISVLEIRHATIPVLSETTQKASYLSFSITYLDFLVTLQSSILSLSTPPEPFLDHQFATVSQVHNYLGLQPMVCWQMVNHWLSDGVGMGMGAARSVMFVLCHGVNAAIMANLKRPILCH